MKIQLESSHEAYAIGVMHKMYEDFGFVPIAIKDLSIYVLPMDTTTVEACKQFIYESKQTIKRLKK